MKKLLQRGEPINVLAKDEYGFTETPLTKAIKRIAPEQSNPTNVRHGESTEVIRLLLDYGADPNMPNGDGVPPLFVAASQGDVPTMELLIAKGAQVDKPSRNKYGQEIGLVEAAAGQSYSQNALLYLLNMHVSFDPDAVLKKLCWNDGNDEGIRALLAYPVTFSDDVLEQLETQARGTVLNIVALARKHNQIVRAAQAAKQSPQLMFKPIKPVVHQIDPPTSDGPLVQAVVKKDFAIVKALIESGADVNSITSRQSPLMLNYTRLAAQPALNLAILVGSRDIALYLLDHGANPDLTDGSDHGDSPLALAVRANDYEMVQKLIANGADVNRQIWNIALTPLAEVRSAEVAKLLIDAGADPNLADTMHRIVNRKDTEVVRYVLSRGGRLDQASMEDGNTPLHKLIHESYTSAPEPAYVQFLIDNFAPLDALNFQKQTPHDLAVVQKFDKIIELLAQKGGNIGDPETALFNALVQDDVGAARRALDAMGQIKDQNVLLGFANYNTKRISLAMLELMTAHGADYSHDFGEQGTLLHMLQDPVAIEYLIKHGANVDAERRSHETPLHAMVSAHSAEAVRTLLKYKAFPNTRNESGATPLCLALQGPHDRRPADGPAVDWDKDPKPYLEIIKLLAQAGADPNMLDERGCQPWGNDFEYSRYRRKAETILAENTAPIAVKVLQKKQGHFIELPYSKTNALFWAVRDIALQPNQSSQSIHPVLQAAQTLYQHYPNSAADFSDFIRRIRFHPEDPALTWRSGGDTGLQRDSGETLLHTAAYYGDLKLVEQLVKIIGPQRLVDKQGKISLFYAANSYGLVGVEKALQMVDFLRNQGGENINDSSYNGETPLLVSGGVSFKGDSPTDQYMMIRGLLARGADPTMSASAHNVADIAQAGKKSATEYKRYVAARAYQSLLDNLAKQNILPEQRNDKTSFNRDNPFHMAVASLNVAKAKRLMSEGKGFKTAGEGRRLLVTAISSGDAGLTMAQLLMDNGAQMDSEDPSLWAASLQQDKTQKMLNFVLIHASPSVNAIAGLFYRSTHTSTWGLAFSTLLDHGVAINFCVDNPLSKAVMSQDLTAVKVLLQYGARKDACPKNPITPSSSKIEAIREVLAE